MSKHERQDDDDNDKYAGNGYQPGPIPAEGPGGKYGKPDENDNKTEWRWGMPGLAAGADLLGAELAR
jgi:hypothetical protein